MSARLILSAVLAVATFSNALGVELVRTGKPVATIVVAEKAPAAEKFAAAELQSILEKMSGAKLPIAATVPKGAQALVIVGQEAARAAGGAAAAAVQLAQVRDDGYSIMVANQQPPALVLAGTMPRGTLYAVYNLLETELDCGFFCDGDNVPRSPDIAVRPVSLLSNPVLTNRPYWMPLRAYGPKRFQPALWNLDDWKAFLGWMAKKKLNTLAIPFSSDTRAWGTAFDAAFPEAKKFRQETLPASGQNASHTAQLGWGLSPEHTTALLKQVLDYARNTLGLDICYILPFGDYDISLQKAMPNLRWKPAVPANYPAVAGGSCLLSRAEPTCRALQERLWKAIVDTYGPAQAYVLASQPPPNPVVSPGPAEDTSAYALEVIRKVDPKGKLFLTTWDAGQWGATDDAKTTFINQLDPGILLLYYEPGFSDDSLFRSTEGFGGRKFDYAAPWGSAASNDLFENRFAMLRNVFRHLNLPPKVPSVTLTQREGFRAPPEPKAVGFWNCNDILRVNALMDDLCAEYAWTGQNVWRGEGATTNRMITRYLRRRYARQAAFAMAESCKQAMRGAPRGDAGMNYRAYVRWADVGIPGLQAARAAIALALGAKAEAGASPFFERDLVDLGRSYLHQNIQQVCSIIITAIRDAKRAKQTQGYSDAAKTQALERLKTLEADLVAAHTTLTRLIATRQDLCLDDALIEAARTPGVNKNLALAVREQACGLFAGGYALTDTIEYHKQLKARQIRNFLAYAKRELEAPSSDPVPAWQTFFQYGARDFVEKATPKPYDTKAEKTLPSRILQEYLETTE